MTDTEERIVLTRWSPAMAFGVLVVTGVLAAGPLWVLLNDSHTLVERIVMGVFSVLFAIPFLWTLWRIPKTVRGMGVAVDHKGIHPFDGKRTDTIAWSEIARVGFGSYSRAYRGIKTKTMPALEVYRTGDDEPALRYTISPYGKDAERIEAAVRRFHPERWAGPFTHEP
ncbi:MAG TPA: hypothetical protein VHI10_20060 [Mycobacterium sp.]|nr:hypothetical protein [Mycobacterium sp.]